MSVLGSNEPKILDRGDPSVLLLAAACSMPGPLSTVEAAAH